MKGVPSADVTSHHIGNASPDSATRNHGCQTAIKVVARGRLQLRKCPRLQGDLLLSDMITNRFLRNPFNQKATVVISDAGLSVQVDEGRSTSGEYFRAYASDDVE